MFCGPLFKNVSCKEISARQFPLLPLVFTFQKARLLFFHKKEHATQKVYFSRRGNK